MNMQEDKSIIEVSHVSKYFGDKTALDDVTLNVKKGEFVTILGPSGSVKPRCCVSLLVFRQLRKAKSEFRGWK